MTSPDVPTPVSRLGSARLASQWEQAADGVRVVLFMLAVMWGVWIVDALDHYKLNQEGGILPRDVGHLWGILTAPFLHASFTHILGNSVLFLILGVLIAGSGVRRVVVVTALSILISGLGVWLVAGSHTDTVGASGVVFGFATYLVARGVFSRRVVELVIGVVVAALFGLSLLADLVPHAGVSWQGHLFGAVAGVIAAALLSERRGRTPTAAAGPARRSGS